MAFEKVNAEDKDMYKVTFEKENFSQKPQVFHSPNFSDERTELTLQELANEIAKGKGFGVVEDPNKFLLCLDFDNTLSFCGSFKGFGDEGYSGGLEERNYTDNYVSYVEDREAYRIAKKDLCPKSPEYITMDDALAKLKEMGIEPAIAYHTYSSTPEWERFRFVIPFEREEKIQNENEHPRSNPSYEQTFNILSAVRGVFGSSVDFYDQGFFYGTDKEVLFNKDYKAVNEHTAENILEYFERNVTNEEIFKRIDDAKDVSDYIKAEAEKMDISKNVRDALIAYQSFTEGYRNCKGYEYLGLRKETFKKALDAEHNVVFCGYDFGTPIETLKEWRKEWEEEQTKTCKAEAEKENNDDIVKAIEDYVKEGNGEYHITEIDGKDLGFDIFVKNDEGICDIAVRVPVTQNSSAKIQGIRTIHSCDSLIGDDFSEKFTDALNKGRKYIERTADKSIEKG